MGRQYCDWEAYGKHKEVIEHGSLGADEIRERANRFQ
jgi:hypothetical protein